MRSRRLLLRRHVSPKHVLQRRLLLRRLLNRTVVVQLAHAVLLGAPELEADAPLARHLSYHLCHRVSCHTGDIMACEAAVYFCRLPSKIATLVELADKPAIELVVR